MTVVDFIGLSNDIRSSKEVMSLNAVELALWLLITFLDDMVEFRT